VDFTQADQRLMGYKILNLNNSFSDATFMREVLYFTAMRKYSPVPKSSFVKLMINGGNWGVYTHVQQLNSDLVDEWFTNDNGNRWKAGIPAGAGGGTQPGGGGGQLTLEIWLAGPAAADLNGDGQIDEADFAAFLAQFQGGAGGGGGGGGGFASGDRSGPYLARSR
jgi:hypothetical protein